MRIQGSSWFYLLAGVGVLYVVYRATNGIDTITGAVGNFWDALTFDAESLGAPATLTESAEISRDHWEELGYLEILPGGGTRITPEGEAYIQSQQRAR